MTDTRRFQLIGPHRRLWTAGIAAFAFSTIAVLATACGGGGSGGAGGSANAVAHLGTTTTTLGSGTSGAGTSGAGAAAGAGASTGANPSPQALGADLMKFSACMRSHGVPNFPNPVISSSGVSLHISASVAGPDKGSPQFRQAAQACRKYAPAGPTTQSLTTAQQADYLKAAQCMRAHGIHGFPDPDFSGGNVRFPLPQNMNPNTTQFEAARHVCQNLIPNGLPYSSTDENP
jgi:hypothetical protein